MPSKLAKLAKNLITNNFNKFRKSTKMFEPVDLISVTNKCYFPYEYITYKEKFKTT